jgi:outer membrane lipoprotein-sorting protein
MKKKYYLILLFIIFIISVGFIFYKNSIKNLKIGNNKNSQEIVDYILNLSSYEAEVTVNITSNKNSNKYILKQKYQKDKEHIQEVIEPSNIAGVKIINDGKNLKIENSNLNLNEIIENYTNLENNNLDLSMFIDEYKNSNQSNYEEKDDKIIMKVKNDKENIYVKEKTLYIDKKTYKPVKLEIKDNKQKERIYILYNEVEINV